MALEVAGPATDPTEEVAELVVKAKKVREEVKKSTANQEAQQQSVGLSRSPRT